VTHRMGSTLAHFRLQYRWWIFHHGIFSTRLIRGLRVAPFSFCTSVYVYQNIVKIY
jgi:hypothetical protein